ncbi:hypothetical protein [Pseudotamlana carrageenivorans]|uniref:hypothetical protein n=1 Tax=Pseudotamlana carrageenivorans TaxID=2069432 RepID=UPI0013155B78|nr:hypothetical protein [Tamlana carrageenivorans]
MCIEFNNNAGTPQEQYHELRAAILDLAKNYDQDTGQDTSPVWYALSFLEQLEPTLEQAQHFLKPLE